MRKDACSFEAASGNIGDSAFGGVGLMQGWESGWAWVGDFVIENIEIQLFMSLHLSWKIFNFIKSPFRILKVFISCSMFSRSEKPALEYVPTRAFSRLFDFRNDDISKNISS